MPDEVGRVLLRPEEFGDFLEVPGLAEPALFRGSIVKVAVKLQLKPPINFGALEAVRVLVDQEMRQVHSEMWRTRVEPCRVGTGPFATTSLDGRNGAFFIDPFRIICS